MAETKLARLFSEERLTQLVTKYLSDKVTKYKGELAEYITKHINYFGKPSYFNMYDTEVKVDFKPDIVFLNTFYGVVVRSIVNGTIYFGGKLKSTASFHSLYDMYMDVKIKKFHTSQNKKICEIVDALSQILYDHPDYKKTIHPWNIPLDIYEEEFLAELIEVHQVRYEQIANMAVICIGYDDDERIVDLTNKIAEDQRELSELLKKRVLKRKTPN